MARKLRDQLPGIHGCSKDEQERNLSKDLELVGNNHNGLSETFNDPPFPSALREQDIMGPHHIDRYQKPNITQLNTMF